jgi:hypothetical protein
MGEDVRPVAAESVGSLRAVIAAGELDADEVTRAYVTGAAAALDTVARGSADPPTSR